MPSNFPHRPDHPDFWLLSEVMIAHDAAMDQGDNFEDAIGRFIHLPSLVYVATGQAQVAADQYNNLVWTKENVRTIVTGAFTSAFIAGMRYQTRKNEEVERTQFPWVVDHTPPEAQPGDTIPILARFTNVTDAEEYIGYVIMKRDPEGVNRGDYGITGPSEDS